MKDLGELIKNITVEPETGLNERIFKSINKKEKDLYQLKLVTFTIIGLSSLATLIPVIKILINDFNNSGLYEYSSLIFSNTESILTLGKEYILIIAESMPILSITLTLSVLFIFILSIKKIVEQININQIRLAI